MIKENQSINREDIKENESLEESDNKNLINNENEFKKDNVINFFS